MVNQELSPHSFQRISDKCYLIYHVAAGYAMSSVLSLGKSEFPEVSALSEAN